MNPKSITVSELYGEMNLLTREWTDGLLSKTFRQANEKPPPGKDADPRWILFDGDVDAVWVENMNSVMDDNKLLTLINGDRIRLERYCKLLFEVSDLQYASPATISRCGMVYVDPKNLGYQPYWNRWLTKWEKSKDRDSMYDSLKELYSKYLPPLINRVIEGFDGDEILKPFNLAISRTDLNLVTQLTRLIDSMINPDEPGIDPDALEFLLIFAIIWSIGACIEPEHRKAFEEFLRKTSGRHLPPQLYDYFYDYSSVHKNWLNWEKMVKDY
jgi:dynein heavy chain